MPTYYFAMKNRRFIAIFSALSILILGSAISCSKSNEMPAANHTNLELGITPYNYAMASPAVGQLGRVLFYDKQLSVNNGVSCGSCHKQALAFSDNHQFSTGFENRVTTRNTQPIQNLGLGISDEFAPNGQALFWDGRQRFLNDMVLEPVGNHIEMGMRSNTDLLDKLSSSPMYAQLFQSAYGDSELTLERISEALAGFVGSMISHNSKFEQGFFSGGGLGSTLNGLERLGLDLFVQKYDCMTCHDVISTQGYSETFGEELVNIGLDADYADNGAGALNGITSQNGKFKIPNLRNVALTAPYMHDGRFASLEEVIDHYSTSVAAHPNLDDRLKDPNTGMPLVLNITSNEKTALIAFLHSLTDQTFISDPKFSDPFVK